MNITAIIGSPRKYGNSTLLLKKFIAGASEAGAVVEQININKKNIAPCRGCLRCNIDKTCAIKNDDWQEISSAILGSDAIVIGSPIYFHHFPGPLKILLDRFRSFVHVKITEDSLEHTPWVRWAKKFVLLLSLGSSSPVDATPVIDMFKFMVSILGPENSLDTIVASRLQIIGQIKFDKERLTDLYPKIGLPAYLVENDYNRNQGILEQAYSLGRDLVC